MGGGNVVFTCYSLPPPPLDYIPGIQNRPLITGLGIPLGCKPFCSGYVLLDYYPTKLTVDFHSDLPCILHEAFDFIFKNFCVCTCLCV